MSPAVRHARVDDRESWSEARFTKFQRRKIRGLAAWAYRELPFYRRRFDEAGFDPEQLGDWANFARLPIFGKADVLRAMEDHADFAVGMERKVLPLPMVLGLTSGTLGTTILAFSSRWRAAGGRALARAYRWAGFSPGMRLMTAAPAWHGLAVKESYALPRLRVTAGMPWGTFLPRFSPEFLDALLDLRPEAVSLFLPMLYALLAECRRRGLEPREAFRSVRTLVVVGAPMTPRSRRALEAELRVQDLYEGLGSSEGLVAMECAHHRAHHVFVDVCHVEVVDPVTRTPLGRGQRGLVVITSLNPHGSVYLRYDTEDLGELLAEPCACGRSWPLLKVYDRWSNRLTVACKTLVPYDVRQCLEEVPELVGVPFAVVRDPGSMPTLRLAVQRPAAADLAHVTTAARAAVGAGLGLDARIEWVEELPARWKGVSVIAADEWGRPRA